MPRAEQQPPPMEQLTPVELVRELGIPDEAAPDFATAPVRLPTAWLEAWRGKTGPRELTPDEVALITGKHKRAVYKSLRKESVPHLRHRAAGHGRKFLPRIAPADLWNYLRAENLQRGGVAPPAETPTQSASRRQRDHAAALEACRPGETAKKTRTKERRHDQDRAGSLER